MWCVCPFMLFVCFDFSSNFIDPICVCLLQERVLYGAWSFWWCRYLQYRLYLWYIWQRSFNGFVSHGFCHQVLEARPWIGFSLSFWWTCATFTFIYHGKRVLSFFSICTGFLFLCPCLHALFILFSCPFFVLFSLQYVLQMETFVKRDEEGNPVLPVSHSTFVLEDAVNQFKVFVSDDVNLLDAKLVSSLFSVIYFSGLFHFFL